MAPKGLLEKGRLSCSQKAAYNGEGYAASLFGDALMLKQDPCRRV
jgi:hypothetical protein